MCVHVYVIHTQTLYENNKQTNNEYQSIPGQLRAFPQDHSAALLHAHPQKCHTILDVV